MKSAARDGDSAEGGSPATPKEAPALRSSTAFSMSTPATVGQPTDVFLLSRGRPVKTASPQRQLWTCSKTPRRNARGPAVRLDARSIDGVASGQEEQPDRREQTNRGQHGFVVARPFGIPVYVSPYWFIIAGVFSIIYANDLSSEISGNTRYVVAVAFVVLLYLSVLVHELSHSVVARGFGLPVRRILLYPLGGFSEIEREPQPPGREVLVSAGGPVLSLLLAAGGWGLTHVVTAGTIGGTLIFQLMWANLIVGGFNLLPGLPLDGGRMRRAVIWKVTGRPGTSTIAAAWAGRVLGLGLFAPVLAPPVESRIGGDMFTVIWVAVIAAFMWTGAGQAIKATRFRERLPALQARRLARKAVSVAADTPLAGAHRRAEESRARA